MSRPVAVVYDVADNARRAALGALLRRAGALWLQGSTWVVAPGSLPPRRLLVAGSALLSSEDRLWAYEVCPTCERRARWQPTATSPYRAGTRLIVLDGNSGCPPD